MRTIPAAFLATLIALPIAAACSGAMGDWGNCDGEIIQIGLGDATPFATIYYVVVGDTPDQGYGYVESNGVVGLQRGWCTWGGPWYDPCKTEDPAGPDFGFY